MANEPKDPNSTPDLPETPEAVDPAIVAAEAAMAQARAAEAAAAAARARAEALLKNAAPPPPPSHAAPRPHAHAPASKHSVARPAVATSAAPTTNPEDVRLVSGGEFRTVLRSQYRTPRSNLAMVVGFIALFGAAGFFIYLVTNSEAKARMDAAFSGNTCGPEEDQSCFMLHVTKDKMKKEAQWLREDLRAKSIYGAVDLKFTPSNATVEIFQIRYRQSGEEWRKETPGKGTLVCVKGDGGKDVCEFPYTAMLDESNGTCNPAKTPVTVASVTGTPIITLQNFYVPIHDVKRDCSTGDVTEVFNYDYRLVFSHKDYDTKTVVLGQSAWTPSLGVYSLDWPGLELSPKPEIMKDPFLKVRNDLFCWMKTKKIESIDKVAPEQFDAFKEKAGFKPGTLYDRTETFWTTGANQAWWDGQWKEIQAQKCDEGQDKKDKNK